MRYGAGLPEDVLVAGLTDDVDPWHVVAVQHRVGLVGLGQRRRHGLTHVAVADHERLAASELPDDSLRHCSSAPS